MKVVCLAGTERDDYETSARWMQHTSKLCDEYWECGQYYPFTDGELAAVSVLCAAAARAGYTPIAEHKVDKIGSGSGGCRADLWFNWKDVSRSFEFKHWRNSHWGFDDLQKTLEYAEASARMIPSTECHRLYAGVIAPRGSADDAMCTMFAKRRNLAFRLSDPMPDTYFVFTEIPF